ncbi:IPT/TIG domain-containing protein [Subtercola sp. PAMC28395]|uniref:phage tail tube protein n=1 Tax=Subtercola sp. PAMC28395 TaxID=2846775 RepID=UPI001C0D9D6E|nr:IPT/TIG domain-containing protein [Subtercola sp. PAMC28395]QWT24940.1 IPT/TIG domain-containing protein [Subtercola sp. PAMC28395]
MSKALARRFKVDVSVDGVSWTALRNINDFAPKENATNQSTDDYDNGGFAGFEKTLTGWQLVVKFSRDTTGNIPSDPGQLILENTRFQFGDAARAYVRWYDRNGATIGNWSGRALVDWNQSKTGIADIEEVTATLQGDGILTTITNPGVAAAVPNVITAAPPAVAVGGQVTLAGTGFTGTLATTGVKFGGVNATTWTVLSDSLIVAVMPAGSAGSAPILVTNAVGPDATPLPYTRGA